MSSSKSPGNARPEDASKQGSEQRSGQADNPKRTQTFNQEGGEGGQQAPEASRSRGERNGSKSGGGKS
jgi:hypothetical protein